MKHYGDITKLNGADLPIVDIITGGSPCQDLSVAGKRAGLAGERSGLFMEQIRIIKEMRDECAKQIRMRGSDEYIRPRYMVWENVPGAFSSNKGEDFRAVLEETAKVADEGAVIPGPPGGKWTPAGCIMGDGWSIAWRVHDAQFWGVPQRRKRIALVADFGGEGAPEILFERKGLPGDIETCGKEREGAATDAGSCATETGRAISFQERAGKPGGGKGILIQNEHVGCLSTLNNQSVCAFEPEAASRVGGHVYSDDVAGTVRANAGDNQQAVVYGISSYDSNAMKSDNPNSGIYEAETARTLDLNGGSPACNQGGMAVVCATTEMTPKTDEEGVSFSLRSRDGSQISPTLTANNANGSQRMPDKDNFNAIVQSVEVFHCTTEKDKVQTLKARDYKDPQCVAYGLDRASFNQGINAQYDFAVDEEKIGTQVAKGPGAVCQSVVRRLTPMECERLQNFPDHWTDIGEWTDSKGKKHKDADSPRYKALGNSIALPFWEWMAKRMVKSYPENADVKMASLFDGIGGFPLSFSRAGVEPVWASEIEEFPMAVTRLRFPE